jgi:hypothetical protein
MTMTTVRTWRHWLAHILWHHLPEQPYPSNHPSGLRRAPRDQRG